MFIYSSRPAELQSKVNSVRVTAEEGVNLELYYSTNLSFVWDRI